LQSLFLHKRKKYGSKGGKEKKRKKSESGQFVVFSSDLGTKKKGGKGEERRRWLVS